MNLTYASVSLTAIAENIASLQRYVGAAVKVMPSVKADAYGHGAVPVAWACVEAGAYGLCVATIDEGLELRQAGITCPILVLCTMLPEALTASVEHDLMQTVTTVEMVMAIDRAAASLGKTAKVHLNLETGINRAGIRSDELDDVLRSLLASKNIEVAGAYTHFASSDAVDKSYANNQIKLFEKLVERVRAAGFTPIVHASNSGGVHDLHNAHYDLIRPGISTYGHYPSVHVSRGVDLTPALCWKTHVVRVKTIDAGECVSYNHTWTAWRKTRVATIAVGYGDGYKRSMSGKAQVLIGGKRMPIIGTICMDQCMVDVTDLDTVNVGDEVVLIGRQADETIELTEMAKWADTISYEILLSISKRVPRVYD